MGCILVKRRRFYLFFIFLLSICLFKLEARADMGPKPSVSIDVVGVDADEYYVTLLSSEEGSGPYYVDDEPISWISNPEIWYKFKAVKDPDGFFFLGYYEEASEDDNFTWGYYPPDTFKVLIYIPSEDRYIIGPITERYAFASSFEATAEGSELTIVKNDKYPSPFVSLILRILVTLLIELSIAFLFKLLKKKMLVPIIIANVLTQLVLNAILYELSYSGGKGLLYVFAFFVLEFFIFLAEAIFYHIYVRVRRLEVKGYICWLYAFTANAASFFIGLFLSVLFDVFV